ncbi:Diguanylate cyclase/phosphodiesterase with PAS/PAC sensor(S) (fragment) [Candidatus Methylopumilus turicensis]|uniref:Diguanylate cyclase/phosphodiesterase with PAS/PAC sensor(S) n=1 Tax=Candidatus Methylopumilus turicensis TaxID=1581680 RepID=A0A0B7J0S0_9PROT
MDVLNKNKLETENLVDELVSANKLLLAQNAALAHENKELGVIASIFNSQEGMAIVDASLNIVRVNKAFTEITGYSAEEAIGMTPKLLSSGKHDKVFYARMWQSLNNEGRWEGEIWNRRKNGEIYPQYLSIAVVYHAAGHVANYVSTLTDISKGKAAADKISNLAFYDPLTQLPNRRLFLDRLGHELVANNRDVRRGALLFIDLDHFKNLNDTLGHMVGDLLLQQVAARLMLSVRKTDTVARLSGDEFFIFLANLSDNEIECAKRAKELADKMIGLFDTAFLLNEHSYRITASMGVTLFNGDETSIDMVLKQADIAMYQAKAKGRNTVCFFENRMQDDITRYVKLERELTTAIALGQFELFYQVQVDDKQKPFGAEALIRWNHPELGLVSPGYFIEMAEETGLIVPIGQWVLEAACEQLKAWEAIPKMRSLTLAVNISSKQFHQDDFVTHIKHIVKQYGIHPALLKLELTETAFSKNIESLISSMTALKGIGIQFELDDFGTGYSSLQYLKRLPLEQLKIDQSFVREIEYNENDKQIVRTIISMTQNLDLKVIAEGVETENQKQILLDSGCQRFQGYLFGKPLPIAEFEESILNSIA